METTDTVAAYHHGGGWPSAPTAKLYLGQGRQHDRRDAQDLTNIYGKILRINPDGSTPSDNPSPRRRARRRSPPTDCATRSG